MRTKAILFFLSLLSLSLFSQQLMIEHVDSSDFPKLRVFVRIEKDGQTIKGLGRGDFSVKADQLEVANFKLGTVFSTRQWLAIGLALDISGSMAGDALRDAKTAAMDFVERTGVQDRILLVTFATRAKCILPATPDKKEVKHSIQALSAGGNTALRDAIKLAVQELEQVPARKKTLIVLTDGRDTSSRVNQQKLQAAMTDREIKIYTVGLGQNINERFLQIIAADSGGRYFHAPSPKELITVYREISKDLASIYFFEFSFPLSSAEEASRVHRLTISTRGQSETLSRTTTFFPANVTFSGAGKDTESKAESPQLLQQKETVISKSSFSLGQLLPALYYALMTGLIVSIILILIFKPSILMAMVIFILLELLAAIVTALLKLL